jgi:hydrogenase-4 component B
MLLHALGVVVMGVVPQVGLAAIAPTLSLFAGPQQTVARLVAPLQVAHPLLLALFGLAAAMAWLAGRGAKRSATWGCGYTAISPRMQYTGGSFSDSLVRLFRAFLPSLRRERLPQESLPGRASHLATHHFDAVERRMFEMLSQAEDLVAHASERIPEQSRFAFAAGLVALVVIGAIVLGASAP